MENRMEKRKDAYKMIENMLDDIALARRAMIVLDGEEPKKIDDFISSIGAKKIEEADKFKFAWVNYSYGWNLFRT